MGQNGGEGSERGRKRRKIYLLWQANVTLVRKPVFFPENKDFPLKMMASENQSYSSEKAITKRHSFISSSSKFRKLSQP